MTDDFESAVRKIARKKNGDDITSDLVWDLIEAIDADGNKRHKETLAMLAKHVEQDRERSMSNARLQADECAKKHAELFGRSPHRRGDPDDADYSHGHEKLYAGEFEAAAKSRKLLSREQIVANFWVLVALLALSGVVNGLVDLLFKR